MAEEGRRARRVGMNSKATSHGGAGLLRFLAAHGDDVTGVIVG